MGISNTPFSKFKNKTKKRVQVIKDIHNALLNLANEESFSKLAVLNQQREMKY